MNKEEGQHNDGAEQSHADKVGLCCIITNPDLFYLESQFYGQEIDSNNCTNFSTMPF